MKQCLVVDLGQIEYGLAWDLQRRAVAARKARVMPDVLLLCEHPHVITLGRNANRAHLLAPEALLRRMGVACFETNRGGDVTYHGPGQLVGYPILDLAAIRRDVAWYVRNLEEAMVRATLEFGIAARRVSGRTGVWVDVPAGPDGTHTREEKLAAIGVHLSRWVTSHGFAYNVSTGLRYFDLIVPCGIADKGVTSLEKLIGRPVTTGEIAPRVAAHLAEIFGLKLHPASKQAFEALLDAHESQPVAATA